MFKSYNCRHGGFTIEDTNFIEYYSINIAGIGWANFAILVADVYCKKKLPIVQNVVRMLKFNPLADNLENYVKKDVLDIFELHKKYKYLVPCLKRELNA